VDVRDGRVLLKCFAGCSIRTIMADLSLTWADLHEHAALRAVTGPQLVVDAYEYASADGVVYARKLRLGPIKAFRWERWDSERNDWRRGLAGLKPGLFALERVADVRDVVIVEGEKSARLLQDRGFVSVAPPCGANLWVPDWTASLWQGGVSSITVLPDQDVKGIAHAARVAATCHTWRPTPPNVPADDPAPEVTLGLDDPEAAPLIVRLVQLPDLHHGEDVYDWLTTYGHTADDLRSLIASTPAWAPVDPVARRRELTRARVRRYRALHSRSGAAGALSAECPDPCRRAA
jgi:hypothetical protein